MRIFDRHRLNSRRVSFMLTCALTLLSGASAATTLSDIPVGTASSVPANLMLALSVEYPTGTVAAYKDVSGYSASKTFLGYFDNTKCYDYTASKDSAGTAVSYFVPYGNASTNGSCVDSKGNSHWSGNMLNWATMTSLDEFRQALTGGNRSLPSPGKSTDGDTTTVTVLLRSTLNSQSSSGNFPDKQIGSSANVAVTSVIGDSTFAKTSLVYIRNYQQSSQFEVSNNSSFGSGNYTDSNGNKQTGGVTVTYNAAVQVCVAGMLEANCNSNPKNTYPNSGKYNKPEGLIQQNYQRIRVGAAGYLYKKGDTDQGNGIVRALLQDNGPDTYNGTGARGYAPCSASNQNPNSEWDCVTGIFNTNPYNLGSGNKLAPGGGDATTSGAINYLNKFGYNNGYETYDNIGDLYWASLAYLMNVPLASGYTAKATASNTMDVNFPMYPSSALNDPVKYSCQANAIVTIGDSHTWYDTYVPSSSSPSALASPDQSALTPVNGADAGKYATMLGNLPLIETDTTTTMASVYTKASGGSTTISLGSMSEPNGTTDPTYNMAGLAYFAHTQDIRPAPADGSTDKLPGKQTVDTYTVDVLEPGGYDGSSKGTAIYNPSSFKTGGGGPGPNMYWLAAKYGGFNDINGDGKPANFLTWHTNSSTAAALNLRPDNYFPGNQPDLIQNGLKQIFNKVSTTPQSAAGPGVTVSRVLTNVAASTTTGPYFSPVAGFPIYTVSYTPTSWTGDVQGYVASATVPGSVTPVTGSQTWSAQGKLDALAKATGTTGTLGWNSGRRIMTYVSGTGGVPFRWSNLSSAEQTALGTNGSTLLNYLRGDQSNESSTYRARLHILGDIVHSEAVLVQNALSPKYSESFNPGYTAFSTKVANRAPVVYAGANDGMLHAFEGDFKIPATTDSNQVTGGGSELYAYVPSFVFNGPTNTPQTNGLQALAILNGVTTDGSGNYLSYAHHFYVDATPTVADIDTQYVAALPYASPPTKSTASNASWQTILVGGLGKGGMGYYALNITNVPSAIDATSSTAAVEQTLATSTVMWEFTDTDMGYSYGEPLVVKTRKYGWVVLLTSGYNNPSGKGHLYVVNPVNGTLLETLTTSAGSASAPSGLAHATGYTKDVTDNTVEQVYAGDLLGNVWRFDLSQSAGAYPAPTLLATLTDPSGSPQPVTTAPRVELDLDSNGLDTRRWVFVGTGQALDASDLNSTQVETMYALRDGNSAAPATTGLPITRKTATLHQVTDLTQGVTVADTDAGWFYDLTGKAGTNGGTERIVVDPDAAAGVYTLTWATMTPTPDPCTLAGNIYAVSFGSGASVLLDSNNNVMAYQQVASAPTKIEQVQLPGTSQLALLYGQASGPPQVSSIRGGSSGNVLQRVNWREVLKN